MTYSGSVMPGICVAAAVAGPTLAITTMLASLYLQLPAAIPVTSEAAGIFLLALIPAAFLGAFVALPVNAMGALLMQSLAEHLPFARSSAAWAIAGAMKGAGVAWLFSGEQYDRELAFGLVVTAALCGWLCSRWVRWTPQE